MTKTALPTASELYTVATAYAVAVRALDAFTVTCPTGDGYSTDDAFYASAPYQSAVAAGIALETALDVLGYTVPMLGGEDVWDCSVTADDWATEIYLNDPDLDTCIELLANAPAAQEATA